MLAGCIYLMCVCCCTFGYFCRRDGAIDSFHLVGIARSDGRHVTLKFTKSYTNFFFRVVCKRSEVGVGYVRLGSVRFH